MNILAPFALILWIFSSVMTLWGTWLIYKRFRAPSISNCHSWPDISVLKPLKNPSSAELKCLESFFQLDYPNYEILISYNSEKDPSLPTVRDIIRRYPHVPCQLIINYHPEIENPKVNNLYFSYQQAKYDILLISDSNIYAPTDYLKQNLALLKKDVGLVTSVVSGKQPKNFFGHVEICSLNTFSARWMLILNALGSPVVMGKSMLFRRQDFDRFGGIQTLGAYIAEDYMAGLAMKYLGKKVEILNVPSLQDLGDFQRKDFFNRQIRWGRLRKSQSFMAFFAEPLTTCIASAVIGAFAFYNLFHLPITHFLVFHLSLWIMMDAIQLKNMGNKLSIKLFSAWIFRELTYLPIWLTVLAGRKVDWKGRKIILKAGGLMTSDA